MGEAAPSPRAGRAQLNPKRRERPLAAHSLVRNGKDNGFRKTLRNFPSHPMIFPDPIRGEPDGGDGASS